MDFSSVYIDSCFLNLWGEMLLVQESVLEGVDWGGEGRCLFLFYQSMKQGKESFFSFG